MKAKEWLKLAWLQAIAASVGSLYFSEIERLAPCKLCWEQRIAMFPLVIILGVGLWLKDRKVVYYALPLAAGGWLVAVYHNLLTYGVIDEGIVPCGIGGISCALNQPVLGISWLTIPLLSLLAFSVILGCLWLAKGEKRG